MKRFILAVVLLVVAGCGEDKVADVRPPPQALSADAIGHYCGMNVEEHAGPKGQILLASRPEPIWFSSARDAVAFTMLPEEPKDIRAIYVSDMAKAPRWEAPGPDNWVEAREAVFVIGSRVKGGMGADETVPFSDRAAAQRFASENGGRLISFADLPRDYGLAVGGGAVEQPAQPEAHNHRH